MINLNKFIEMLKAGGKVLALEQDYINDLNVFPVPDGDTGSNMNSTVKGAIVSYIDNVNINSFNDLAISFSKGLLMNARGNSGVIFSQIMRGFFSNFNESTNELTPELLQESFLLAKQKAYDSVVNPIEGTILTVIRIISEKVNEKSYSNVNELFKDVIHYGQLALDDTPNLLAELAEIGVVDSGGYGFLSFLKGMNAVLDGTTEQLLNEVEDKKVDSSKNLNLDTNNFEFFDQTKKEEGFGYCSEVILNTNLNIDPNIQKDKEQLNFEFLKKELQRIGNSLVCVQMDNLVKIHLHTMTPNKLLEITQKYGEFEKIKIENMTLQYEENVKTNTNLNSADIIQTKISNLKPKKGLGILATAPTIEIANILKDDFNVDEVIVTENNISPSIEILLNALYKIGKKSCLIVTDDSNLILVAEESKKLVQAKIECEVIPARNAFETIISVSNVDTDLNVKTNTREIIKVLKRTLSALISTSSRDVKYSNIDVKQNSKIGIIDKKIVISVSDEFNALKLTFDKLIGNKKNLDLCYLIYGSHASINVVKQFEKYVNEQYGMYCEIRKGNQDIYDYYIGLQ